MLKAVAAASADDVWAVGSGPQGTLVLHWDGTAWSQADAPGSPPDGHGNGGTSLLAVAAAGPDDVWAVGDVLMGSTWYPIDGQGNVSQGDTRPYFLHWDGQRWSQVDAPPWSSGDVSLVGGVAAVGPSDAWAAGSRFVPGDGRYQELVLHWNGVQWTEATVDPDGDRSQRELLGATAAPDGSVWVVGGTADRPFPLDDAAPAPLVATAVCLG